MLSILSVEQTGRARPDARERTDLSGQYRPIGIGAVAAAVVAAGKAGRDSCDAGNSNERTTRRDSLAA